MLLVLACGGDDGGPDAARDARLDTRVVARDAAGDAEGAEDAAEDAGEDADAGEDSDVDAGPPLVTYTEEREPCLDRNAERNVYWGDLHVHTQLSFDAYLWSVRATPADAYRFARGEEIRLPPLDDEGRGTVPIQLAEPLDFAAVTDHAELLAEVNLCLDETSDAFDTPPCVQYRTAPPAMAFRLLSAPLGEEDPMRDTEICGDDLARCSERVRSVWSRVVDAADAAYDRTSACSLTTFVGYEHTGTPDAANVHRNVIFRNDDVPEVPISYIDAPRTSDLWARLDTACVRGLDRCDVLTIPHNANAANGRIFALEYPPGSTEVEQRALAELRNRSEPLLEIYQHKGASECQPALGDDHCNFEFIDDALLCSLFGCENPANYYRWALSEGLAEEARLGVDPLQLGVIASTDTHNGTPGYVSESAWRGHVGLQEETARDRLTTLAGGVSFSPGGLAAVWAVENSRDALFDAMRRRETYGTSGPRIEVRFFGGWDYPTGLCERGDFVTQGYDGGVPMGGTLRDPPDDAAPTFVFSAAQDETLLQRIQIIKITNLEGEQAETIVDVAGDSEGLASVDTATCETSGPGFSMLCGRWRDPDFDPAVPAAYYVRVLENPTCRWSSYDCNSLLVPPRTCDDVEPIQERAWTSPIWYRP